MVLSSISSMLQEQPDFKTLELLLWEATAAAARAELMAVLEALDAALMARRSAGLRHCGWKRRMVQGLIGPVAIRRRRYVEVLPTGERRWRYLLDEALGLPPAVTVSPGLRDRAVEAAVRLPYRQAAALKVVTTEEYPYLDIRVDDHPDPVAELRRLFEEAKKEYLLFKQFLPSREKPAGIYDRALIDRIIQEQARRDRERSSGG